jgi:hypothetical protein
LNKRQAKKRNKKFGYKKWSDAKRRISFYEQIIKPVAVPRYVLDNFLNSEFDDELNPAGAYFKEYLEKTSKTRHATLKFLPDEFWGIEEEV